jgi:hypothetical protein
MEYVPRLITYVQVLDRNFLRRKGIEVMYSMLPVCSSCYIDKMDLKFILDKVLSYDEIKSYLKLKLLSLDDNTI